MWKDSVLLRAQNLTVSFLLRSSLPPTANIEKVTSSLSPEGILTVEAPINKPALEYSETTIPVNVESSGAVAKK